MIDFVTLFFEHGEQVAALLGVFAVWWFFSLIGRQLRLGTQFAATDHVIGWSVCVMVFTLLGVATSISFMYLALALAGLAIAATAVRCRPADWGVHPNIWRAVLLGAPLFILASAMQGSQWDEFATWLVIPKQLALVHRFPAADNPFVNTLYPAYPFGWHLVSYFTALITGEFRENAGALSNLLLLMTFAAVLVQLMARVLPGVEEDRPTWGLCAVAVLAVTLLNPTFVQKIVLTTYADTASGVLTGLGAVMAWSAIGAMTEGDKTATRHAAWRLGLILVVLVSVKQATLALVLMTIIAFIIAGLRAPEIKLSALLKVLPVIVLPAAMTYAVWRYHVTSEISTGEFPVLPFDAWYLDHALEILGRMALVLSKKGYYLILAVLTVGFGVRGLIRWRTPFDRFCVIAAVIIVGYNGFLYFTYLVVFTKGEALRAASYWRYNMHLGLVVVTFAVLGGAHIWRQRFDGRFRRVARYGWVPVMILLIAPVPFAKKLRFDRAPMIHHYRAVGAEARDLLSPSDLIYVIDPAGTGESGVITGYQVLGGPRYRGFVSAFQNVTKKRVAGLLADKTLTALIIHSVNGPILQASAMDLKTERSYLLHRNQSGAWKIAGSWDYPAKR